MFLGPLDAQKQWDSQAINGNFRFLKKVLSFVTANKDVGVRDVVAGDQESAETVKARHAVIKKVTEDIDNFRFNTAISALMEYVNTISKGDVSQETLEGLALLLSPFAPHLAEELWERLGHSETLAYEKWPEYDESFLKEEIVKVVVQINGKKRALVEVPADISEEDLKEKVISEMAGSKYIVTAEDRFITVFKPKTKVPKLVNVICKR